MDETNTRSESETVAQAAKIRVAYLLADPGVPYLDSWKGSSIHARSMVRAFEQEGGEVDVLALSRGRATLDGYPVAVAPRGALTSLWRAAMRRGVGCLAGPRRAAGPPDWVKAVEWLLRNRDFIAAARRRWAARPPQLIYARHAWLAYSYARLRRELRAPLVLEVNAVLSIEKDARGEMALPGRTRRIEREIFDAADLILPVSAAIKAQIEEVGIDPQRVVVMPNAVDPELFRAPPAALARSASACPQDAFLVGMAGSFRPYHGTATLLRAAAAARREWPGLRLRLVGGGPELERMRTLAAELGLGDAVEFTGVVDHARVPGLLAACDLCVAPYEGQHNQYNCPMKLFEYMALETPIVASAWGDIPNIVKDGQTALLHPPGDAAALAQAILAVARDPQGATRRAQAARVLAERHTWRAVARRILDWRAIGIF